MVHAKARITFGMALVALSVVPWQVSSAQVDEKLVKKALTVEELRTMLDAALATKTASAATGRP